MSPRWKTALRGLRAAFALAALAFLAAFAWRSRTILAGIVARADPAWLALAVGICALLHLLSPLFTVLMLRGFGVTIGYGKAFGIHVGRLPAKYLPGGIWHTVARMGDYHRDGLETRSLFSYFLLENVATGCGALALGGAAVAAGASLPPAWQRLVLAICALALAGLVALPPLLERYALPRGSRLPWGGFVRGLAVLLLHLSLLAAAFGAFLRGLPSADTPLSPFVSGGVYLFAWGIGFLAIFAPQGIGVSEFVAGTLLAGTTGLPQWVVLLTGFRAVILLGDLIAFCTGLLLPASRGTSPAAPAAERESRVDPGAMPPGGG